MHGMRASLPGSSFFLGQSGAALPAACVRGTSPAACIAQTSLKLQAAGVQEGGGGGGNVSGVASAAGAAPQQ